MRKHTQGSDNTNSRIFFKFHQPPIPLLKVAHSPPLMPKEGPIATKYAKQNLHHVSSEKILAVTAEDLLKLLQDVHGVLVPVTKTPELVAGWQKELLIALNHNVSSGASDELSQAYAQAHVKKPEYIQSQLLTFLGADCFDVQKAKDHVLKHFQMKLELFGLESLARDLQLKDLSETDRLLLDEGGIQVLPQRDWGGRAVVCQIARISLKYPIKALVRLPNGWNSLCSM